MSSRPSIPSLSRRAFLGASAVTLGQLSLSKANAAKSRPADPFPKDFQWGAATAAYQIEGAAAEDGRGPSVWDTFSKKPGATWEGNTGDVACDHYHRFREDVGLLKALGVTHYRFSVSWPRVLPAGVGAVNSKGLDFYDRLLDELQRAGITPLCTVYHWDLPQALEDRGGWVNREIADWFAEYTAVLAKRYGDRIKKWVTLNEPQAFIGNGYLRGEFAPGLKKPFPEYLTAAHNAFLAHGRSVQALRANVKDAQIGYVVACNSTRPASDKAEDVEAARYGLHAVTVRHPWMNAWWMDPVLLGSYPEDGLKLYGKDMPAFKSSDFDVMKQPIDFLGLNIYAAWTWRHGVNGKPEAVPFPIGYPRGTTLWHYLAPDAVYWAPRFMHERYKLPVAITENGLASRDHVFLDGKVHDAQRVDYLHRVLLELARAIKDGVPVNGYYAWSLLDNFEWADGYRERFGLIYVDYPTQKRIPKDSYHFYKQVIATRGRSLASATALPAWQMTP
jgi:beta-glucosidase